MPETLDRLIDIVRKSLPAPTDKNFAPAMRALLIKSHTAAQLLATAERAGVKVDSGLFKGLSKAERADIKAAVEKQLPYLKEFVADLGNLSEAQIAARAGMYVSSVKGTFNNARYPGLSQVPGDGQTVCLSNCACNLDERDDGIHWILTAKESCPDCEAMAAGSPYEAKD